ncbi:TetR/AcrR family transcriptional regulator [Sphingopyxis yananensis]|uniref:TetR/AcrR family transcriptional regulator n=1 Tax=Sphingopyxis yananensis TaxID=2886687 RepID=UPI001D1028AA|nr:TetR/AcrR family transcriptional regulator [Sphingopyxis yananensis]MCC2603673.1 TetR/AcrR family transcriptional regulator [Sphingopyxis yananensis]
MPQTPPSPSSDAAKQIKLVALRLFAQHGIDGVSVRQIADAAGQKNHNAITYYFGSKDALIRELIVDGAKAIDQRRNAALDAAQASGGPSTVRQVMEILVDSSIDPNPPIWGESYTRFIVGMQMSNRALFMDALAGRWNSGYLRCLDDVRRLCADMPADVLNQRLVFMGAALGGIISGREAELSDHSRGHPMWSAPETLRRVAAALAAIITQDASQTE